MPPILPVGTRVVLLAALMNRNGVTDQPAGAVGIIVHSPDDPEHAYRVRFPDGAEATFTRKELTPLKQSQGIGEIETDYSQRVIFRCVIGSQAYGLSTEASDVDRRGIFLPRAENHWSLYGVPEQIENDETQECYWELRKFLVLALKANPNVLECLFSPIVESATPLARELLGMRSCFLSKLAYQTFNGYVISQFKKMQADLRNHGKVKWKHVMHLVRLVISGTELLRTGELPVNVGDRREQLLSIRRGEVPWPEIDAWRLELHKEFTSAYEHSRLPDRPDYAAADAFLVKARRAALSEELP